MHRPASDSLPKPGRIRRLCLLIPLLAIGVIAPTACYYEDFGYGTASLPSQVYGTGYGQVPAAIPYGAYAPSVVSPFGIDHIYGAGPYGGFHNYGARPYGSFHNPYTGFYPYGRNPSLYHGGGQRHVHSQQQAQPDRQIQAARQQEQSNERRKESQNEGWQYEDRNERRRKGSEESHEESKKRRR